MSYFYFSSIIFCSIYSLWNALAFLFQFESLLIQIATAYVPIHFANILLKNCIAALIWMLSVDSKFVLLTYSKYAFLPKMFCGNETDNVLYPTFFK